LKNFLSFFKNPALYTKRNKIIALVAIVVVGVLVINFQIRHVKVPYDKLTILLNDDKYEEVIKIGESYLKYNSQDEKLDTILAKSYVGYGISNGKIDEYAKKALSLLDTLNNKSLLYYGTKGYVYYVSDNYDGCIASYKEALNFGQENPDIITKLAQCYEAKNMLRSAVTNYKKALDLNKDNSAAMLGFLRMQSVFYHQNEMVLNKAYSLSKTVTDPEYLASLNEIIATMFVAKGEPVKAEARFLKSLEVHPMSVVSLVGLADIYLKQASQKLSSHGATAYSVTQKSEELAKQALKYKPNYIYAYVVLFDVERIRNNAKLQAEYKNIIQDLLSKNDYSEAEKILITQRLTPLSASSVKSTNIPVKQKSTSAQIIKK
jgi:tetratricopeptide (TPR) repeat protein